MGVEVGFNHIRPEVVTPLLGRIPCANGVCMKTLYSLSFSGLLVGLLLPLAGHAAGSVTQRGPSQLQLDARSQIDPTDVGPGTGGGMRLQVRDNGKVRKESLLIQASGLEPDAQVGLTAAIGSDSNVSTILTTTSDSQGKVGLSYQSKEPAPARTPRGQDPVPGALSPLTNVRGICIENNSAQVVGFAWVVNATSYRYIVRRNLTSADGTAEGSIRLIANQSRVNFTLLAGGLTPGGEYSLVVNGAPVLTQAADDNGRLRIRTWPTEAVPPLQVRTLELAASGGGTVLSTNLPE